MGPVLFTLLTQSIMLVPPFLGVGGWGEQMTGRGCILTPTGIEGKTGFLNIPALTSLLLPAPLTKRRSSPDLCKRLGPWVWVPPGQGGSDEHPQEREGCLLLWRRVNLGEQWTSYPLPPSSKPVESFNQVGC